METLDNPIITEIVLDGIEIVILTVTTLLDNECLLEEVIDCNLDTATIIPTRRDQHSYCFVLDFILVIAAANQTTSAVDVSSSY